MASTPAMLYAIASAPTAKTEVIAAEPSTIRVIRKATFTNNSGGTLTVELYIDPDGSTEVQIVNTKTLIDKETWSCPDAEGQVLSPTGTVDINTGGANIGVLMPGIKIT